MSRRNSLAKAKKLGNWTLKGNVIRRSFNFVDFVGAMRFVNKVARLAEDYNHHPDITIRYSKVTLALTTHDEGGLTEKDFRLARRINNMLEK